ncbi:uncharacterized protein LOC128202666 isoform X2 [Mya arenaria]|nr:uncharacterized protein LOC128202666 isoform X2 [Mya arenaria]XP_052759664.1 uncharacterized protein LOC128202666 isoform X2 [Mya arenaria]
MFGESSGMADAVLLVEKTPILVIKAVLGVASPVFRAMFESDFKEKGSNKISLPGKKLSVVVLLLECIYPDILRTVTADVAFKLIPLAEEYQISKLKAMGEKVLVQALRLKFEDFYLKECTSLYAYLYLAATYHLQELHEYCVTVAADFMQSDREKAMLKYKIPDATIMKIDKLAICRHEIFRADVDLMMENIQVPRGNTATNVINSMIYKEQKGFRNDQRYRQEDEEITIQAAVNTMCGLRLAYIYAKDNFSLHKSAILMIRRVPGYASLPGFKLMPENIKRDIVGVSVDKFN